MLNFFETSGQLRVGKNTAIQDRVGSELRGHERIISVHDREIVNTVIALSVVVSVDPERVVSTLCTKEGSL